MATWLDMDDDHRQNFIEHVQVRCPLDLQIGIHLLLSSLCSVQDSLEDISNCIDLLALHAMQIQTREQS